MEFCDHVCLNKAYMLKYSNVSDSQLPSSYCGRQKSLSSDQASPHFFFAHIASPLIVHVFFFQVYFVSSVLG